MTTITPELRAQLEKIAWKHYDPEASINVEEMLDEMAPILAEREALAERKRVEQLTLARKWASSYSCGPHIKLVKVIDDFLTQTSNTDL